METLQEDVGLTRPSLESPLLVAAAMVLGVACLFGATKWALNEHFAAKQEAWDQEVAEEQARIHAVEVKRAEQGEKARADRVSGGMRLLGDRVLEQMQTGLMWTAQDNGSDLSWKGAIEYCRKLALDGGGWELPTAAQLLSLYDRQMSEPISCGDTSCKVSALFKLSRQYAWSNESAGDGLAWYVSLDYGTQFAESIRVPSYYRALCVRQS